MSREIIRVEPLSSYLERYCGRRVGTAEGRITDTKGRLLAHGTTTCLIFPS